MYLSRRDIVISTIVLLLTLVLWPTGTRAAVVAVNAGGSSYTAADGTTYGADIYFNGGSTYSSAHAISGTEDDALYQGMRYGYGNDFSYNIPISNGTYDVTLKFAELYYDNIGDQIFSVSLERTEVVTDLDILEHAGKYEAYDVTIPSVAVSDGELNITFSGTQDATICAIEVNLAASMVNISADPFRIDAGGSSTISWSSSNADTVSIDNGIGTVIASGSLSVSPAVTTTYTITADGPGGTAQDTTTVIVNSLPPTVTITANPVYLPEGGTTTLTWSSTNAATASIDNGVGPVDTSGTIGASPSGTGVITYIITVTGPGGTAQDSVDVTVNPLPTVSISTDRPSIAISESATITWSSANAVTVSVEPINSAALSGSQVVTPVVTTTYTITGTNTYGSREDSVTIMVDQPPTVNIQASPAAIVNGSSSTLTWASDGADTLSIDQGIGTVAQEGSRAVTPSITTSYTITAINDYGSRTGSVTVTVSDPATASITASPNPINAGQSTTLTWSSTNAATATIEPGIGTVEVSGTRSVSPAQTTTYTLSVSGPGGDASHSVTVTVNQPPTVIFSADPAYLGVGDSATLTWTSTNATSASIDQGIGAVAVNGSITVSPLVTTNYTITVSGSGGTADASTTVTVHAIPTVSISADVVTINAGDSAALTWTSSDAQTATINAIGHVDPNGTTVVSPVVTTTYTITVEGYGGSASDSVTVSISSQMSVAVNCGGEAYTALDGTNYVADTYYTGGNIYSTNTAISGTSDDELYQSQRYGYGSDFSYAIPLANWNYDITFRFAEMYYDNIGDQVFSVSAEGLPVITDIDILSRMSKFGACDVTVTSVNVTDGVLNLTFSGVNDAAICAIKVVPTPPTAGISATPNPLVEGQTALLSWNSADGTAASIDQGIGTVTPNVYSTTGVAPVTTTTYTIMVEGPGGTATESVVLSVNNLPVVDITTSPGAITEGESATLQWTTMYTDTISIDQGIGDVTGTSSCIVSPDLTTTYTITAANAYGSRTDSVTVTVNSLPVISSFEATPNPIIEGTSTTLSWTTAGASSVSIDQGIGGVSTSGSQSVSPLDTVTYELTATNAYGSRTATVTVEVGDYPMVSISALPATITEGASSTLSWTSANAYADSVSIDQGIGPVPVNESGSEGVSPVITTIYTITATNASGTSTDSVTVTVNNLPSIDSFTADSGIITEETSATLSWSVTNADAISLNQGIGTVGASGTQAVTPSVTTTYTLTATNIYGSRSSNVTIIVNELPTVSISAMPASISEGESSTLSWNSVNADSASIDQAIGAVSVNGSTSVSPALTTTYTITATNTYGSRTDSVTVLVDNPPTIDSLSCNQSTIVEGGSTILSWSSTGGDFASIDHGIGSVAVGGSATVSPLITTTYTLTLTNTYGSDTASITIIVNNLPQVNIAVSPDSITQGESSTLFWTSSGSDSVSIDQGIASVTANTPGSQSVTPSVTTTYTITAVNTYGSRTDSVTLTVNSLPTVSINADTTTMCEGDPVTLAWNSTGANTVTIDQGIGAVAASGSRPVSPLTDTTYTIVAANAYGTASQSIAIAVDSLPAANLAASPNPINVGESTTLSWRSSDATTVSIDQGIGSVTASGTTSVSPTVTTTYTLTASNACGDATDSVTVTVYAAPTVSIAASESSIIEGDTTTLSWTSANATTASIDQGIGAVNVNGSTIVSPDVTTTYTVTADGPAGTGSDSVTVTVNNLPVIGSLSASPTNIASGGSSTISWTTSGATSVSMDQGVDTGGATSGTADVTALTLTTTYTLTATNAYGSRQETITIMVAEVPRIELFSADPAAIAAGSSSTLAWRVSGADSVSIDQGVGTVGPSGTTIVTPGATTTYTITATNTYGSDTDTVVVSVGDLPTVSISASPNPVVEGEPAALTWSSTDADTVIIDQGIGVVATSGMHSISPLVTTTYNVTASNPYGTATGSVTVTVNNLPVIASFSATPAAVIEGQSATLSWTTTGAGFADIDQGVGSVGLNSSKTVSPLVTTVYTMTATNTFGSSTASVTVTVHNLPTVIISSDLTSIIEGESATLSWSSTDASSLSIDHGIGAVAASGSTTVSPLVTTTYRVTALNAYGSDSQGVTVTVNNLPVVSITATPDTITEGSSATLAWNATNADSASIDQGIGVVALNGSRAVTPSVTTTYTLTATNTSGLRSSSASVTVGVIPTVIISASPSTIIEGESTALTWSSTDATTVNIDHGIGTVTADGTVDVSPMVTTTYSVIAANAYGIATDSVTVTVNNLPVASITATPGTLTEGETAALTWSSSSADSVNIVPDIGISPTPNTSGAGAVAPAVTTTYTITATNTYGSTTKSVTVTVNNLPVISSFTTDALTVTEGVSANLSWATTGADSTSIDQGIGAVAAGGTMSVSPVLTTTYTLTAANAFGTVTTAVTVTVNNLPTVSLSASSTIITEGESTTLSWTSTNAGTLNLNPGDIDVTGSESYSVSPVVTTVYTITATNAYGERSDTATVTVNALPTVSLSAEPAAIFNGETSSLSWSSSEALSVYINQGLGSQLINVASSTGVSPTVDTTYVIIATNAYGSRSASTAITVTAQPLPAVSISASPNPITSGQPSTLTWTTTDADTVEIDQGIGAVAASGTRDVTPALSTTYTITATNTYGSASGSVTVVVGELPFVSISASKGTITEGETTTLIWDSINAETCTMTQDIGSDIGSVAAGGTMDVEPSVTTAYTIIAHNTNGDSDPATITVTVNPLPTIDTFTATPGSINNGDTTTLSWTTTNASSASIDKGIGTVAVSGSVDASPLVTTTYTITAVNAYGTRSAGVTVTVTQLPTVNISASPGTITSGASAVLSWNSTNADTVSIDQNIGVVALSGSRGVSPAVTTTYTITATNTNGTVTDSVTVTVGNLPTIDTFSAGPVAVTQGEPSTLTWATTNADSVSIDQGIGSVVGSGSYSVTPAATTTYTLTAANTYGSVTGSVTVTVGQLPRVDISNSPDTITEGGTVTLSWTSINADSCSIDSGIGTVALSGSVSVTPTVTTIYTITATNASGAATDSVNVTVNNLPSVSISADPGLIVAGSSTMLTWTSSGADSVSLSHGIGAVASSGSQGVSPSFTTTYTITAANTYGSVADTVTVTVYDVPAVTFTAEPANIITGGMSTLSWTSVDATSASIDNSIGSVDPGGSLGVAPLVTTTYVITVDGPGGTATGSVTVGVHDSIAVNIIASPAAIITGEQSVLFWNSTGATSVSIDNGIGDVGLEGWKNVSPAVTTTYTVTAAGDGGTVSDSATITVSDGPTVNILADPNPIMVGSSTTLTWSSTGAATASINNSIGDVEVNGSMIVSPAETTTYTITVNGPGGTATSSITVNVNGLPAVSISADPLAIAAGASATLTWASTDATSATLDDGSGPVAIAVSGSQSVSPAVTTTYTIIATNAPWTATDSVVVTVYPTPTVTLSADTAEIVEGASAMLSWTSTDAASASINQSIGSVDLNGSTSVSPAVTTTYTITVTGQGGTATDSETITVNQLPNVNISASPNNIAAGGSTTLTWSSSNADSVTIDQGIGAVALSGTTTVSPALTTTYTVTATKNGIGDTTATVTIMVEEPPTVDISASPAGIAAGGQAVLAWTSSGADTVSINPGIGAVALEGQRTVSPAITTSYTITAVNTYGTGLDNVTITVSPLPTVNLSASPTVINVGQGSTLTWTSSNATAASIDSGIGAVAVSGTIGVAPIVTTTYTITVSGPGGAAFDSVTVNVNQGPTVSITAGPQAINPGGSSTLSWTSTSAISASIDQGIGTVSVNGSTSVTPAITTAYTITVDGPGGSATDSVTVTVNDTLNVTISATPNPISLSQSTTLTWTSANVDSASIDQGIGAVAANGSMSVTPASTRTYTITVEGAGGSSSASIEVVVYQPPEVTIAADPDRIIKGDSTTLTWTSLNADTVTIDQGIGAVALSDSLAAYPVIPTLYTITATGDWGLYPATDSVLVGVVPREAAYIPTYAIVPGGYSYSIAVVDLEIPAVTYTLDDVGNKPFGVVVHPSNEYIYVSCFGDQTVEKIDTFTGEVLEVIDVTDPPRDIAITPDGSLLYVTRYNSEWNGEVAVIDTEAGSIIGSIGVRNHPKGIAMSADGSRAYISSVFGSGTTDDYYVTSVIADEHRDDVEVTTGTLCPFDLAVSPDGSRVYMANLDDGLSYLDTATNDVEEVLAEYRKSYTRVLPSTDGTLVYAATFETYTSQALITVIDPDVPGITATIALTAPGEFVDIKGMALHPTQPYLYVVCSDSYNLGLPDIYVIDTDTNTVVNTLTLGRHDDLYGDFLIIRP